jgi:uncharacterized membrane protein
LKISFNQRFFGFFGFAGFLGLMHGLYYLYMLFMFFFFFAYARPKTKEGAILSDERWAKNVTQASRNAFYVFLIPSMLSVAFLRNSDNFLLASVAIPIAALLSFAVSFVYYDLRGD